MGLSCASCSYDNDPTRVYCHNCGAKIERGASAPAPPTGFTHPTDVAETQQFRAPLPWGAYFGFLFRLCLLAAFFAVVALALLPPVDVPPFVAADESVAQRLSGLVSDASSAESPRSFAIPATDLQKWLASAVSLRPSGGIIPLKPRRVYAVPLEGRLRLGLELVLPVPYSLFMQGEYVPVKTGNGYTLQPAGYSIGRLPLPLFLGHLVESRFGGLRDALLVPLSQMAKASRVEIAPQSVSFRWPGAQSP